MKEELINLKGTATQLVKEKKEFNKQRLFFNMKVEEKKEESNIEELFLLNDIEDSYEAAKLLNCNFPQIANIVATIKEQHPKYGIKRIKEETLKELDQQQNTFYYMDKIVDNYILYDDCGFSKVKVYEDNILKLTKEVKDSTNEILDESIDTTKKTGETIVNVVKPYGEIAKSQLGDAKETTKKVVNEGTKKLIKVLEKVQNKTEEN